MEKSPKAFYDGQISSHSSSLKNLNKRINLISFGRLGAFLAMLVSVYFVVAISSYLLILTVAFAILLGWLVKYHLRLEKEKNLEEKLLEINKNEIKYLNLDFTEFRRGSKYVDDEHPFSSDLNIFGTASLFQYINCTSTSFGQKILASILNSAETNKNKISEKQEAHKELAEMPAWRQKFQAIGSLEDIKKVDLKTFNDWLKEPNKFIESKSLKFSMWFFPILLVITLIIAIIWGAYNYFEIAVLLEVFYILSKQKAISPIHEKLTDKYKLLQKYSELLRMIENENFKSVLLQKEQAVLTKDESSAAKQLKRLSSIMDSLDTRLNILASIFTNVIYMSDLRSVIKLEKWKEENRDKTDIWFEAMGRFDAYSSFGTFAFNNPDFIYAEISDESPIIKAEALGHPLIPESKRVCNDFELSSFGKIVILTGANMAGKSTFLRTVGINMVLGMAGAPVCAKTFTFRPLQLVTSISIKDSLFENESYFYAELKRLQNVIDRLNRGE
jgi:DNA mismatch repair ATPase MutS